MRIRMNHPPNLANLALRISSLSTSRGGAGGEDAASASMSMLSSPSSSDTIFGSDCATG